MLSINWVAYGKINYLDADSMNDLIASLEADKTLRKINFYTCRKFFTVYKTYCIKAQNNNVCVRVVRGLNDYKQYVFSLNDAGGPREEITGNVAYDFVDRIFQSTINNKKTLFSAFSGMRYKELYNQIKKCVPKQISMLLPNVANRRLKNVFKADISSAYPYEGTKILPTLENNQLHLGTVKPTKDYPFAFYLKSHHMAIYNEFDTHDWKEYRNWYTLYDNMYIDINPDEDLTVLCKVSPYSLEETFKNIYQRKLDGDKVAKIGMNAAIGYFQKNSNPKLAHITACIIGRCCERMIQLAEKLKKEGNHPVFIATDSIAWVGKESKYAEDIKYLGSFSYEYKMVEFYATGPKAYQIKMNDGKIKTVYAGMKNGVEKNNLCFGNLPETLGNERYVIDQDSGKIITINF